MPNYNYEEWLHKSIGSLLEQTYKNFEIIFVDDCSTDESVKIARELLRPPHKIVELKQRRYNGGARNEGYLYLSDDVDYVWYIDSDDWVADKKVLERINKALQSNPDVLFVGYALQIKDIIQDEELPEYRNKYDAMRGFSGSCSKVIKKELATKQECLFNEGTLKEDKNQHFKICLNMRTFDVLKEPVYIWNKNNSKSVTTVRSKNILWKTSTIRHYADTLEIYLTYKDLDTRTDQILLERLDQCKKEIEEGGDRQF